MAESSARLLQLLSLLQLQREWSGAELADRLGISARTLRRDVEMLRELEYPVHAIKGRGGGYRLGVGARLPPLQLAQDEAVATAIGLRTAASSNVHGVGEAALRAMGKLQQVMPSRLRQSVSGLDTTVVQVPRASAVDPDVLMTVADACRNHFRLRFDYVRNDGERSLREVEPYQLVAWVGQWYLVAWDAGREDWRTFRVDRIRPRVPLGRRFEPRELPDGDAGAFLVNHVRRLWRHQAVIRVQAPADSPVMQRWATWGEIEPVDASSCRLRVAGDTPQVLASVLAELDAEFQVEEPEELVRYLKTVVGRFSRAVDASTPPAT